MENFIKSLSNYNKIIIQPHDFPDADAISSAYGLQQLIKQTIGKESSIYYHGESIDRPSIKKLVEELNIELHNFIGDMTLGSNDILILVDCHYFGGNVRSIISNYVAYIDHHTIPTFESDKYKDKKFNLVYFKSQSKAGACASLIELMYNELNQMPSTDVAVALTVGIMKDTKYLITNFRPIDERAFSRLQPHVDSNKINSILRVEYAKEEVPVLREMLGNLTIKDGIAISKVTDCEDNNLVGQLADFICQIYGVRVAVLYSERKFIYRFSVRSFDELISPSDLLNFIAKGIGGGGGKENEAGGAIVKSEYYNFYKNEDFSEYVMNKTIEYCESLTTLECGKDSVFDFIPRENFSKAIKRNYYVRYIDLEKLFGLGAKVTLKTLEGIVTVESDNILILGALGEIYPTSKKTFSERYEMNSDDLNVPLCDGHFEDYGISIVATSNDFVDENNRSGKKVVDFIPSELMNLPVAKSVSNSTVLCCKTNKRVKIKTSWGTYVSDESAYLMYISDTDYYLCDEEVFGLTYLLQDKQVTVQEV